MFRQRYPLRRTGADDALRQFPDEPVPMPPISCLMRGCENVCCNNREEFLTHCNEIHGGYQSYRNRVLYLLSETVFQFPGSLQRAAMQNFAEFQCRSETDWQHFTEPMNKALREKNSETGSLGRTERWTRRSCIWFVHRDVRFGQLHHFAEKKARPEPGRA